MSIKATTIQLLHADQYEVRGQWHPGKVHAIREEETTLCGNERRFTGGKILYGSTEQVTCKLCLRSLASQEKYEESQRQWAQQRQRYQEDRAEYEAQREAESAEWKRQYYDSYLLSPEWERKRALVMNRASGICECCLERPATKVHHMTYQRVKLINWVLVADEFLWDLRAVCDYCHARIHPEHQESQQDWTPRPPGWSRTTPLSELEEKPLGWGPEDEMPPF
jgi:hypothetical protein